MKSINCFRAFLFSMFLATNLSAVNLSEYYTVFASWVKNPFQVGECLPLSTTVCQEVAKFVKLKQKQMPNGCCFLDAGAGTGAVSDEIVKHLRTCDHLDLVEIDPDMCLYLKKRFAKYPNVRVHCCSILDFKPTCTYNAILSTLPFNSFGVEFAQAVINLFKEISSPGCIITYVECSIVRYALQYFYPAAKKQEFKKVQNYFKDIRSKYLKRHKTVYLNFTPIDVYHLKI